MELHPDLRKMADFIGENLTDHTAAELNKLIQDLSVLVNEMLISRFEQLLTLLYQLDIDEEKLKKLLRENTAADAAKLIAELIIERQIAKIKTRQEYSADNDINEEEKW